MQNGEEHRAIELGSPRYCNDTSLWPRSREGNSNAKAKMSKKNFRENNKSDVKERRLMEVLININQTYTKNFVFFA